MSSQPEKNKVRRGYFIAKPKSMLKENAEEVVSIDVEMEARLSNWRKVVLFGSGTSGSCCAAWAAAYIAKRNAEIRNDPSIIDLDLETLSVEPLGSSLNQLDGWLVEHAVLSLPFDQREVLRGKYVWNKNDYEISRFLRRHNPRANRASVRIVLEKALINLKLALALKNSGATIQAYNLHTWSVPCLEAYAVPVGARTPQED